MQRYYIVKDGPIESSTSSKAAAIDMVRQYQAKENHFMIRAQFSIITGEEENIPYLTLENERNKKPC